MTLAPSFCLGGFKMVDPAPSINDLQKAFYATQTQAATDQVAATADLASKVNAQGAAISNQSAAISAQNSALATIATAMATTNSSGNNLVPTTFLSVATSSNGDTDIWTPVSGKKFRLLGYAIELTGNVAVTVTGATLDAVLKDGNTLLGFATSVYIPALSLTSGPGRISTGWVPLRSGYLSVATDNKLKISLSSGLTSGKCRVTIVGKEE